MKTRIADKIVATILLISLGVMSMPQTAFAGWSDHQAVYYLRIGETLSYGQISHQTSCSGTAGYYSGSLPSGLSKTDADGLEITGKIDDSNTPGTYESFYNDYDSDTISIRICVGIGSVEIKNDSVDSTKTISLNDTSFSLNPVLLDQSNEEITSSYCPTIQYSSSVPGVATVDTNTGAVTPISPGETTITVSTMSNSRYSEAAPVTCALTVTDTSNPPSPNPNGDSDKKSNNENSKTEEVITPSPFELYIQKQTALINNAKAGDTVTIESDAWNSYSLSFMKLIQSRRDITVKFIYTYKGVQYTVVIPAGTKFELDDKIPWYGPYKIAVMFGAITKNLVK